MPILWIAFFLTSCQPNNEEKSLSSHFNLMVAHQIDSLANVWLETGKTLGFSIAVMHKKDTIYSEGFGFSDLGRSKPVTSESIFQIASVSKFITAVAILKLVGKELLTLDSKVNDILPSYPNQVAGDSITIRHLLTHTSGIKEYLFIADSLMDRNTNHINSQELLEIFEYLPTGFKPGSYFSYSNSGYLLLSLIIEKVSGKSYGDFIRDEISIPMGLNSLDTWKNNSGNPNASPEYILEDTAFVSSKFNSIMWLLGDGGLSAKSIELAQIPFLLTAGNFLSETLMNEMLLSPSLGNGATSDYGLGVRKGNLFNEPVWGHTGGGSTWTSSLAYFPKSEICVVVLTNTDNTPVNAIEIESGILEILFREKNVALDELEQNAEVGSEYEGDFSNSFRFSERNSTISTYLNNDGYLCRKRKGGETTGQKLIYLGNGTFAPQEQPFDRIIFEWNHQGEIIAMKDYYNGRFMEIRYKHLD